MIILEEKFKGKCEKQTVVVIIVDASGKYQFIGTNWCKNPQEKCPRGDLPSGEGYDKCQRICDQPYHAEEDALRQAGDYAKGGTMYLIGHYYMCDRCKKQVEESGIKSVIILDDIICKGRNK